MFLQGIETLPLRMKEHCKNPLETARYLAEHDQVVWVRYPGLEDDPSYSNAKAQFENGFGSMIVFGLKSGRAGGEQFINRFELFSHLANVGDAKSLAIHPASTTHSQLTDTALVDAGVSGDMIRLSIGIEDVEDIRKDIAQALKQVNIKT